MLNRDTGNGIEFKSLTGMDAREGFNAIHGFFTQSFNQTELAGKGRGTMRSFLVKEDMDGITEQTQHVYLGLLKQEMHWMCVDVLPARLTDDIFFRTTVTQFEHINPTATPAMGLGRTSRQKKIENMSKSKPYSMAFEIEGEVKDSVEGEKQILLNIMVVVGAMMQHMAFVAYATLRFGNIIRSPSDHSRNEQALKLSLVREVDNFAIIHKSEVGISKLAQAHILAMEIGQAKIKPNICIIPHAKWAVLTTGSKEYYQYNMAGQEGVDRLHGSGTIMRLNGMDVREAPMEYKDDQAPTTLNREVFVGDHHHLKIYPGQQLDANGLPWWEVYDVTLDEWRVITFLEVFKNCGRFRKWFDKVRLEDEDDVYGTTDLNDDETTHLWVVNPNPTHLEEHHWQAVFGDCSDPFLTTESPDPASPSLDKPRVREWCDAAAEERIYTAHLRKPPTLPQFVPKSPESLKSLGDEDRKEYEIEFAAYKEEMAKVPKARGWTLQEWSKKVHFMTFRPMRGNLMQDILFVAGGDELGFTAHGRSGFNVGHDVGNNSWQFQTRFRLGTHVKNWARVSIGQNAIYDGVLTGGNARVMTPKEAKELSDNNFELEDENSPAMYAVCMPNHAVRKKDFRNAGFCETFENQETIISIRGFTSLSNNQKRGDYPGFKYYSHIYGFDKLETRRVDGQESMPIAPMSFKGGMRYPAYSGMQHIVGKGHHGVEGPGCRAVRRLGTSVNPVLQ